MGGFKLSTLGALSPILRRGDIALAVGVMTILVVLILPLPPLLLDLFLAVSIILSVLILMTACSFTRRSNSPRSRPCC